MTPIIDCKYNELEATEHRVCRVGTFGCALENRQAGNRLVGSNPTPSASSSKGLA